ncbi:MAG: FAD-dependent oxidoreductase [Candidatus Woesearchaeota archaeon]
MNKNKTIIIIGGSTAGTICAYNIRKINKDVKITIIEKTKNTQYSPCAMPYVLEGTTTKQKIILLNKKNYEENNIELKNNTQVMNIIPKQNKIITNKEELTYDYLILATGSTPKNPGIKLNNSNYSFFKTLSDLDKIKKYAKKAKHITIIGAGFIGIETAYALLEKNKKITIIEAQNQILPELLDKDMAEILEKELNHKNIKIIKEEYVQEINKEIITNKQKIKTDYTIISAGIMPELKLAKDAGIKTDKGIITNKHQQTNIKNIYAAGDCTQTNHELQNTKIISGLANTASNQAKTTAKHILGLTVEMKPTLTTSITKIKNKYVANTGLTQTKTKQTQQDKILSTKYTSTTTASYYSNKHKITTKIIINKKGQILGAQIISDENPAGYINLINLAITNKIKIQKLAQLETPYNPASNPLNDPITTTAKILVKKLDFLNKK